MGRAIMRGKQNETTDTRRNCLWISSLRGNLQLVGMLLGNVLHEAVVLLVNLKRKKPNQPVHAQPVPPTAVPCRSEGIPKCCRRSSSKPQPQARLANVTNMLSLAGGNTRTLAADGAAGNHVARSLARVDGAFGFVLRGELRRKTSLSLLCSCMSQLTRGRLGLARGGRQPEGHSWRRWPDFPQMKHTDMGDGRGAV